jgi:hypothetical protein
LGGSFLSADIVTESFIVADATGDFDVPASRARCRRYCPPKTRRSAISLHVGAVLQGEAAQLAAKLVRLLARLLLHPEIQLDPKPETHFSGKESLSEVADLQTQFPIAGQDEEKEGTSNWWDTSVT